MKLLSRNYCIKVICQVKENRALFNNIKLSIIENNLIISKKYTYKQKKHLFEDYDLDIDKVEYYYPIVKKLDEIYYTKSIIDKIKQFYNIVLFIFYYIVSPF
jgi:hypothetical protein